MKRSAFALLLGAVLLPVSGCDNGPIDPSEQEPEITGPSVTVQIGESVDAATRGHVKDFVGLGGVAPASGSGQVAVPDSTRSPVLAVNSNGEAVLAALVLPGTTATLDARSSALLLTRIVVDPSVLSDGGAADLEARITAQAGFQALVDSVAARASRGLPLMDNEANIVQALAVAAGIVPASPARTGPDGRASLAATAAEPSRALFRSFSYVIPSGAPVTAPYTAGGQVTLTNNLLVPVRFSTPGGEVQISAAEFCVACWGIADFTPSTATFVVPEDGAFDISARLDQEQMVLQAVLDFTGILFARITDQVPDKHKAGKLLMGFIETKVEAVLSLAQGKSPSEALGVIFEWAASEATVAEFKKTFAALLPKTDAVAMDLILDDVLKAINQVQTLGERSRMAVSYATAWKYWGEKPETATWCIEEAKLYGGCSDKVVIAPAEVTLKKKDEAAQLFATVYDAEGRVLEGKKVEWTSSAPALVSVAEEAAVSTAATALADTGKVTVTAKSSGKTGTAKVTIGQPLAGTYRLVSIDGALVPTDQVVSGTLILGGDMTFSIEWELTRGPYDINGNYSVTGNEITFRQTHDRGEPEEEVFSGSFEGDVVTLDFEWTQRFVRQ